MATDRTRVRNKLDKVFSEYIRERDGYICFCCGKSRFNAVMECGHLITRARFTTRWDEENAHCQCRGCNLKHEYNPEVFTLKYIQAHGKEAYENLVDKSWSADKVTIQDIRDMLEYFTKKLKEMRDGND